MLQISSFSLNDLVVDQSLKKSTESQRRLKAQTVKLQQKKRSFSDDQNNKYDCRRVRASGLPELRRHAVNAVKQSQVG